MRPRCSRFFPFFVRARLVPTFPPVPPPNTFPVVLLKPSCRFSSRFRTQLHRALPCSLCAPPCISPLVPCKAPTCNSRPVPCAVTPHTSSRVLCAAPSRKCHVHPCTAPPRTSPSFRAQPRPGLVVLIYARLLLPCTFPLRTSTLVSSKTSPSGWLPFPWTAPPPICRPELCVSPPRNARPDLCATPLPHTFPSLDEAQPLASAPVPCAAPLRTS